MTTTNLKQTALETEIQVLILDSHLEPDKSLEVIERIRHDLIYGVGN